MTVENDIIQQLIAAFLIIIPAGAVVRVTLCAIAAMHDEDKKPEMKRKGKNAVIFAVFAQVSVAIIHLVYQYYS